MKLRLFVLVAALGGAASTWLPWRILDQTIRDGWQAGGALSFGAFCIAVVCGAYRPVWFVRIALFVLGMLALVGAAKTVGEIGAIQRELATSFEAGARREASLYRVGTGAWLTLAASLGLIFSAFLWKLPKPGPKTAPLPKATIVSLLAPTD